MKLENNPTRALEQVAHYLEAAYKAGAGRDVYADVVGKVFKAPGKDRELMGVWQTPEYTEGLLEIAAECRRVMTIAPPPLAAPPPVTRRITHFQNVHLPLEYDGHGQPQTLPTLVAFADDGTMWAVHAVKGGCSYNRIPNLPSEP